MAPRPTRRVGETLTIGDAIQVTVLAVMGDQVRIGVTAPEGRARLLKVGWQNTLAQTVVGGSCGIAVCEFALLMSGGDNQGHLRAGRPYAWIDRQSLPRPVVSRQVRAAGVALASFALVLRLALIVRRGPSSSITVTGTLAIYGAGPAGLSAAVLRRVGRSQDGGRRALGVRRDKAGSSPTIENYHGTCSSMAPRSVSLLSGDKRPLTLRRRRRPSRFG
jgi:hypothetical protein